MTNIYHDLMDQDLVGKPLTIRSILDNYGTQVAMEGIASALIGNIMKDFTAPFTEMKGWFEGIEQKRRHINELSEELIQWLKDSDFNNRGMSLDMGGFKTWLKTSETFFWRFYFVLNDKVYNEMVTELKKDNMTRIEYLSDFELSDRIQVTRMLDSVKTVKDLISIVEEYQERCNKIFDLFKKRQTSIKGFPFQILLLGLVDLDRTVTNIVNLAK